MARAVHTVGNKSVLSITATTTMRISIYSPRYVLCLERLLDLPDWVGVNELFPLTIDVAEDLDHIESAMILLRIHLSFSLR